MNVEQLIDRAHKKSGVYRYVLRKCYKALIDSILDTLYEGEEVKLKGLGKFVPVEKPQVRRHDPRDVNRKIIVEKRNSISFKTSRKLWERLEKKQSQQNQL